MRPTAFRPGRALALALAPAALCLALAGCGAAGGTANAASSAKAAATPTCPATTPTASVKFVTGKITAAGAGTITVAPTNGAAVTVQVTSTTRLTRLAPTTLSAVQAGDAAQITADSSGVIATRVTVTGAGGGFRNGDGAANSGQPRATRTPGARFNPACFQRPNQAGSLFGAAGAQSSRVTDVSSTQITVTDAQGESLTYGVNSSTVILAPTSATAADLVAGASAIVTGTASGSTIVARSIIITAAG